MKKLMFFVIGAMVMSMFIGVTACGPSAAEKARMDSIRIADSLRAVDSIKLADSLKAVKEAEAQRELYRQKVDETAASLKDVFILKNYDLNKVVAAGEGLLNRKKSITVYDVVNDKNDIFPLKGSEDLGMIVNMTEGNSNKEVIVKVHCGGSGPFYTLYHIDIESMKLIKKIDNM